MTNGQNPPSQQQIDNAKWFEEPRRRDAERAHDESDDFQRYTNEAAIKGGETALRSVMLINGGAAVALLTFIGSLPKEQKTAVAATLVWFASGVALAVAASLCAYFTNLYMAGWESSKLRKWEHPYLEDGPETRRYKILNRAFHVGAVLFGLASLLAFVCGMLQVRTALAILG